MWNGTYQKQKQVTSSPSFLQSANRSGGSSPIHCALPNATVFVPGTWRVSFRGLPFAPRPRVTAILGMISVAYLLHGDNCRFRFGIKPTRRAIKGVEIERRGRRCYGSRLLLKEKGFLFFSWKKVKKTDVDIIVLVHHPNAATINQTAAAIATRWK